MPKGSSAACCVRISLFYHWPEMLSAAHSPFSPAKTKKTKHEFLDTLILRYLDTWTRRIYVSRSTYRVQRVSRGQEQSTLGTSVKKSIAPVSLQTFSGVRVCLVVIRTYCTVLWYIQMILLTPYSVLYYLSGSRHLTHGNLGYLLYIYFTSVSPHCRVQTVLNSRCYQAYGTVRDCCRV